MKCSDATADGFTLKMVTPAFRLLLRLVVLSRQDNDVVYHHQGWILLGSFVAAIPQTAAPIDDWACGMHLLILQNARTKNRLLTRGVRTFVLCNIFMHAVTTCALSVCHQCLKTFPTFAIFHDAAWTGLRA